MRLPCQELSVFYLWPARTAIKKLLASGKQVRGTCTGQQASPSISPHTDMTDVMTVTVAVVKSHSKGTVRWCCSGSYA